MYLKYRLEYSAGKRLFIDGVITADWNKINPQIIPEVNGGTFFKTDNMIFLKVKK